MYASHKNKIQRFRNEFVVLTTKEIAITYLWNAEHRQQMPDDDTVMYMSLTS